MIRCPDWDSLLQHRFDPRIDAPEDWRQALDHLCGCEDCRIRAYGADPTLLFLDPPEIEVDEAEVRRMQQSVAALREGLDLAQRISPRRSRFRPRVGWSKVAAVLVATAGVTASLLGMFDRPATQTASLDGPPVAVEPSLGVSSWDAEGGGALLLAAPARWQDAPVVEEVGSPQARVYSYPAAPGEKVAVVMVIDPALDV